MTSQGYRPIVSENLIFSVTTNNENENIQDKVYDSHVILSLDYVPLDTVNSTNYYCPFYTTDKSDCTVFTKINEGFYGKTANMTGAGLQIYFANHGLMFKGGYFYRANIPLFQLQQYTPVITQGRLYYCKYGYYNIFLKTLGATYATINPILSFLLIIILSVTLYQTRYIYGQDIQQLYYQQIENNKRIFAEKN